MRPNPLRNVMLLLLAPLGLAASTANAFEWFPRNPAALDTLYLVQRANCDDDGSRIPVGNVKFTLVSEPYGIFELSADSGAQVCPLPPPWDSYVAVPVPADIDGIPVRELVLKLTDSAGEVYEDVLQVPPRLGIPPSIAGTWFFPHHAEQGLLMNVSRNAAGGADLALAFNTYAADGTQRWHSGIAPIDASNPRLQIALTDTGTGVFAGIATTPDPVQTWGQVDIEYMGCGELLVVWAPAPYTGLTGRGGRPVQLTQTYGDSCDLDAWMEQIDGHVSVLEVDVAPAPAGG